MYLGWEVKIYLRIQNSSDGVLFGREYTVKVTGMASREDLSWLGRYPATGSLGNSGT